MVTISGTTVNRVNKPSMSSNAQKNSAKITNARVVVLPMPMKFTKRSLRSAKCTSLSYPWFTHMVIPSTSRSNKKLMLKAAVE